MTRYRFHSWYLLGQRIGTLVSINGKVLRVAGRNDIMHLLLWKGHALRHQEEAPKPPRPNIENYILKEPK